MPTKDELQQENDKLRSLLTKVTNVLSKNITKLFADIQSEKPVQEIVKEHIKDNPFKTIAKTVENKVTKSSKWDFYNKVIHYAANENTPLKRRTLDYLVTKIPFSAKAISRQVYRLGYKWKNGKVTQC